MRTTASLVPILLALLVGCVGECPACDGGDVAATSGGEEEQGVCTEPPAQEVVVAEVRALEDAPRRAAPPGTATVAFLARGHNAFLGRLEMEPGAAVPEHRDQDEEYIVILEGEGVVTIDGEEHAVRPGSTIFMPANALVSFANGDARMVAIQVFAGPESAAKYDRWRPVEATASD